MGSHDLLSHYCKKRCQTSSYYENRLGEVITYRCFKKERDNGAFPINLPLVSRQQEKLMRLLISVTPL